jgi:ribonuclease HI
MDEEQIVIYTDGSSRGNPGPGGYGVILMWKGHRKELSAGYSYTTNNRMELMGVIAGLEAIKKAPQRVTIYTDSQYIVNSIEKKWVFGWVKKGFRDKKNKDLWLRLLDSYRKHQVSFKWVKGHASNPFNNRCDELATTAADGTELLRDHVFEQGGIDPAA